jgi:quinol monooxygenase YgiN
MKMASKQVTVLALLKAKPGLEEQVKHELLALVEPTRAEEGCINYDLHQGAQDKSLFMFYENWTSQADLDRHGQSPHIKKFHAKQEELLAQPTEITLWEKLD